jgi:hypothetical protein
VTHPSITQQIIPPTHHSEGQAHRNSGPAPTTSPPLLIALALALGLMAALIGFSGGPLSREAQALAGDLPHMEREELDQSVIRVAVSGTDTPGCGTEITPCLTVQYAVDQALPRNEVRVAAGTYTRINGKLAQLIYLAKSLTIRGGYTTADWTTPDPEANPTTLDAAGEGRVMVIAPLVTAHLEGLRFQGGNATGLGGGPDNKDAGGGLYILAATVTISDSLIFSNTASITGTVPGSEPPLGGGLGGGMYVRGGSLELINNEIVSNTAGVSLSSYGGGIYIDRGSATLVHNMIMSNTASLRDVGYGGGLYLHGGVPPDPLPSASLLDNTLQGNYASRESDGQGGAMYAYHYDLELLDNLIQHNVGGGPGLDSRGGGLYIFWSNAWLRDNRVLHNIASGGKEGISGGVHFCTCSSTTVILENNTILGNTANTFGNGYGGGVSFCNTTATLDSNAIISNTATLSTTAEGWGGGVWAGDMVSVSMRNDVIAGNQAQTRGSGLSFGDEEEEYNALGSRLYHVTIADNTGGIGQGIHVINTVVFLTNTIIAGHAMGVVGANDGEATLEATLWYSNTIRSTGKVEIGSLNYDGDPAFVDPANWDYHIGANSAALDRGVATGVRSDMDGQLRPWLAPDLGADEIWPANVFIRAYLPLILRQSSP